MQRHVLLSLLLLCFIVFSTKAQNTSPYWSLAGNSNAANTSKLGTTNAIPLNLITNNITRLSVGTDGKVGIGTTSPQQLFHVEGPTLLSIFVSTTAPSTISGSGMIGYVKALPTAAGQRLGYFLVGSRGGAENNYNAAGMVGYVSGAWSSTSHPAYLTFETTPSGATSRVERLRIDQNGHLLPGATKAYDLGSSSLSWRNLYLRGDIYLDGTRFVSNAPGTASNNAFVGSNSGLSITSGVNNTGIGQDALRNDTSGALNTAVGTQALYSNANSNYNTAVGYQALYLNTNNYNTATGYLALTTNTGYANDAHGAFALYSNTTGTYNVAYGADALISNTTGNNNTAVGLDALDNSSNANTSTAIGFYSGYGTSDPTNGTFLGSYAGATTTGLSNTTSVGYYAQANTSDQVMLGNTSVTSVWAAGGYVIYSDGRFKRDIREEVPGLSFINKLRPVTYHYNIQGLNNHLRGQNTDRGEKAGVAGKAANRMQENATAKAQEEESIKAKEQILYTGFVAQEVEKAAGELKYDFSGVHKPTNEKGVYGLSYAEFVVPLVKAVQELSKENEELKGKVADVEDLKRQVAELRALITTPANASVNVSGASLEQSTPNPSQSTTTIRYSIPDRTTSARLTLINAKGQVLKELSLSGTGAGQVALNTANLPSGVYTYTLWVNGQQTASKQLVIAR